MVNPEVERFLLEQKYKCDQLLEEGLSMFSNVVSEVTRINIFNESDNNTDVNQLKRIRSVTETNITFNEGNDTEIRRCQPFFDGLLCWSGIDAPGIATLPCPPAWIMGSFADLAKENLETLAVASKVCLASGEWYRDSAGIFWTNYSLCIPINTYMMNDVNELDYAQECEKPAESYLLNKWLPIIRIISQIGYATSFTTLVIAMVVFSLLRKLRNSRNRLHMHLFASFIMRAFMALLKDWIFIDGVGLIRDVVLVDEKSVFKERNTWICKVITSFWQYFIVANYSWILMEGLYLHNLIFFALCTDTSTISLYILLGWGLPVLVVVPWIIVRATIEDTLCWTTHKNNSLFLIIRIPIIISILFNFLLFLNIVRVLLVKLKTSVHLQRKKMQYKKWAKSTLVLVPLFGVHYTFFLGLSYHKECQVELVWLFCDQLFASFQGAFVALIYCLLNGEVRAEMQRTWKTRRSKRDVDSLISGHRESSRSLRYRTNRERQRSNGDGTNFVDIPMRELSV